MRIIILFCLIGFYYGGVGWSQTIKPSDSIGEIRTKLYNPSIFSKEIVHSFEGVVGRVTDSESIWVHVENRRNFIRWTHKLSKSNLNLDRQEVRVWLQYVSPPRSVGGNKEYKTQFKEYVRASVQNGFRNRRVRIIYKLMPTVYRMKGMVWTGGTSLNIWMVQNGLSFYLIERGKAKYHNDFVNAEKSARAGKLGLWQNITN